MSTLIENSEDPLAAAPHLRPEKGRWHVRRFQWLALLVCFLFSIAMVLNIHPIGDGLWFWYAVLWRGGQKLYADMHLPLQPLFVLLTAWTQALLGKSWLAGKALATAQAAVYCLGLYCVIAFSKWKDWQKGLALLAVFSYSLTSLYSRFDDYHITGYAFEVWSIYLLLRLVRDEVGGRELWVAALLGVFSGLSIGNRLNDGGALFGACGLLLPVCAHRRRLLSLITFACVAPLTLLLLILATGDTVHSWLMNTIILAAAIKGGTGNVLASPLGYPRRLLEELRHNSSVNHTALYALGVIVLFGAMFEIGERVKARSMGTAIAVWAAGLSIISWSTWHLRRYFERGGALEAITMLGVPVLLVVSIWMAWRYVSLIFRPRSQASSNRSWLLLIIPLLQIPGTTLSSRGGPSVLEVYPQLAYVLLLLPVVLPEFTWTRTWRGAYLGFAGWLIFATGITKIWHPYYWHHFVDQTMFTNRVWYQHTVYGPMYIERGQLEIMQEMCKTIDQDGPAHDLLSIPIPYPNYFCNVVPWHGYVQTWYDTVSKQTVDKLIGELETGPPKWIIYQRALDSMESHEIVFTGGKPLPHRALDALIVSRIVSGQWRLLYWEAYDGADWLVIKTQP